MVGLSSSPVSGHTPGGRVPVMQVPRASAPHDEIAQSLRETSLPSRDRNAFTDRPSGDTLKELSRDLPNLVEKGKEELKPGHKWFSPLNIAKNLWGLWDRFSDIAPAPWNSVLKFGVPVAAGAAAIISYHFLIHVGVEVMKYCASFAEPLAIAAAFLIPAFNANAILSSVEKFLKLDPVTGWKRQAVLLPASGVLLLGAAIYMQSIHLSLLTYSIWAGAAIGLGALTTAVLHCPSRRVWPAIAAAVICPWAHYLTQRTFDVTVLSAGPDPEVAAWNVGTDLSVADHWKGMTLVGEQHPPSGKPGMVFINRDVPLYLPPHRSANAFNSDFSTLIGKEVRVTTIGGWMKFLSPKLQPIIVKYEVIGDQVRETVVPNPIK